VDASIDSGADGDADADVDTDADADSDADADADADSGADAAADSGVDAAVDAGFDGNMDAYFVVNAAIIGSATQGCDLNGDGKVENKIGELATWLKDGGFITVDLNQSLADAIQNEKILLVMGLLGVTSFDNDTAVTLNVYEGQKPSLADAGALDAGGLDSGSPDAGGLDSGSPDAGPGVFSGQGRLILKEPPRSTLFPTRIQSRHVRSPQSTVSIQISISGSLQNLTLSKAGVYGDLAPIPDQDLLNGKLVKGMICGAVPNAQLTAIIDSALGMTVPGLQLFLSTNADIDGKTKWSVGMPFTAVSIERVYP